MFKFLTKIYQTLPFYMLKCPALILKNSSIMYNNLFYFIYVFVAPRTFWSYAVFFTFDEPLKLFRGFL